MSVAAALLLAAAASQPEPADAPREQAHGPAFETAQVTAVILRPAVLKDGALASSRDDRAPRSQVVRSGGRLTYEFE